MRSSAILGLEKEIVVDETRVKAEQERIDESQAQLGLRISEVTRKRKALDNLRSI